MLSVENLSFRHRGGERDVLADVAFRIPEGARTVLLGPNGCGKSTLLMCLAGVWPIRSGRVLVRGRDCSRLPPRVMAGLMAVVPQTHSPLFSYTVREAVLMGRAPHVGPCSSPSPEDEAVADEAIAMVGLGALAERPYTRISGGERQLALVARALAQQAPIMLLDEPTAHLDFKNQYGVLDLIARVCAERGLTVLVALHDPNLAEFFGDRIVMLADGRVRREGTPEEVLSEEILSGLYDSPVGVARIGDRRLIYSNFRPAATGRLRPEDGSARSTT